MAVSWWYHIGGCPPWRHDGVAAAAGGGAGYASSSLSATSSSPSSHAAGGFIVHSHYHSILSYHRNTSQCITPHRAKGAAVCSQLREATVTRLLLPHDRERTTSKRRPNRCVRACSVMKYLPDIALHCIALHCIALHCIALHCIALHCIALHYITLHCIALHCIALVVKSLFSSGAMCAGAAATMTSRILYIAAPPTTKDKTWVTAARAPRNSVVNSCFKYDGTSLSSATKETRVSAARERKSEKK